MVMESLCYSANKVSDDAYDVSTSLTQSELDRREWRMRKDGTLSGKSIDRSDSKGMSWLCEELDMRNTAFQEDCARNCQDIHELRGICCAELKELDN